jgi:hypothetical protein
MRCTTWLCLLFIGAAFLVVRTSGTKAEGKPARVEPRADATLAPDKGKEPVYVFKKVIFGKDKSKEGACASLLANASYEIKTVLEERGEKDFWPPDEFLHREKIVPLQGDLMNNVETLEDGLGYQVSELVQVTAEQLEMMRALARTERVGALKKIEQEQAKEREHVVKERQRWMGLGIGGVVALLLVGIGYLRLEEATKGYYTSLLRLSAVGILALVGFVIWHLR